MNPFQEFASMIIEGNINEQRMANASQTLIALMTEAGGPERAALLVTELVTQVLADTYYAGYTCSTEDFEKDIAKWRKSWEDRLVAVEDHAKAQFEAIYQKGHSDGIKSVIAQYN